MLKSKEIPVHRQRRRKCNNCGYRFSTHEILLNKPPKETPTEVKIELTKSIDITNAEAKARGLTYGQLQAEKYKKQIGSVLD